MGAAPAMGATPPGGAAPAAGMGGMMADMMAGMMPPKPGAGATPIYPSLMTLPSLSPEKRAEIDALAGRQIDEGLERLVQSSEALTVATRAGDDAAMQQTVGTMREALDELDAGIAGRRVLYEGKGPRNLALDWFKREMNLSSTIPQAEPALILGIPLFHLFTMVLLVAFAVAMIGMYFLKMRRAAALFGRLEAGPGGGPPGSAPPLAGTPAPNAPGGGRLQRVGRRPQERQLAGRRPRRPRSWRRTGVDSSAWGPSWSRRRR